MNQVAIGVPRSGTHFLSTILGWHHERYYRPGRRSLELKYEPEVSWAAVPFVDPKNTFIIHIIRHPLKVMASNIHRDWFKPENAWGRFAHQWSNTWDYWKFYEIWFMWCEQKAHATVRLEDIQHLGEATNRFGDPGPIEVPLYSGINRVVREYGYDS